jgi:Fur family transcriptional regulator, ferric uptake regulator
MKHSHSHDHHQSKFNKTLEVLKKTKLRITEPRKAMLKILIEEHGPFTMEELYGRLKKGVCDLVTVYRSLAALEEAGLVRRCEFGDGSSRYEFRDSDDDHHHHHIICRKCRKVETLDLCLVDSLERLIREKGYNNVSHTLEFFGVCAQCQKV